MHENSGVKKETAVRVRIRKHKGSKQTSGRLDVVLNGPLTKGNANRTPESAYNLGQGHTVGVRVRIQTTKHPLTLDLETQKGSP